MTTMTWKPISRTSSALVSASGKVLATAPNPSPDFWTKWASAQKP